MAEKGLSFFNSLYNLTIIIHIVHFKPLGTTIHNASLRGRRHWNFLGANQRCPFTALRRRHDLEVIRRSPHQRGSSLWKKVLNRRVSWLFRYDTAKSLKGEFHSQNFARNEK